LNNLYKAVRKPFNAGLGAMYGPSIYNTMRTGDADLRFYITTVQDE